MKTESNHTLRQARPDWRFGLVYSDFYKEDMAVMVGHAKQTLIEAGVSVDNIFTYAVPGSFEIPLIGAELAHIGSVDALIGLGIIVEGETHHARLVAENSARGIMDIQTKYRVPFVNEVLYVDSLLLAQKRLTKGKDAACVAIDSLALLAELQS